jgi:hypothetical protein
MKLNYPALLGGFDPISIVNQGVVRAIRRVIDDIHGKACNLAESEDRLDRGAISPCWAFAMSYASQLLIAYGDDAFQDAGWLDKVGNLRSALDKLSRRWKIAGEFCHSRTTRRCDADG